MMISRRTFGRTGLATGAALALGGGALAASPAPLLRRAIPSTGETIPVIGLGTNRYGVDQSEAVRAPLRAALGQFHQLGGTLVDTAPAYKNSEEVIGELVATLGIHKSLFMATKVDTPNRTETTDQFNASAAKLKMPKVDLLQVHNLRSWQSSLPLLRELKAAGRIRYVGITTSRENQYEELERILQAEKLDFVQLNYSLESRDAAMRLLPLAKDKGIAVIVNRALGGGRIFSALGDAKLPDWAAEFECQSWSQFMLKYVLSNTAVTTVIAGMTKVKHVEDNMAAGLGRLPDAKLRARQEAYFSSL